MRSPHAEENRAHIIELMKMEGGIISAAEVHARNLGVANLAKLVKSGLIREAPELRRHTTDPKYYQLMGANKSGSDELARRGLAITSATKALIIKLSSEIGVMGEKDLAKIHSHAARISAAARKL